MVFKSDVDAAMMVLESIDALTAVANDLSDEVRDQATPVYALEPMIQKIGDITDNTTSKLAGSSLVLRSGQTLASSIVSRNI